MENEIFKVTFDKKLETLNSEVKRLETHSKAELLE